MPGVETVVSYHCECFLRKGALVLDDVVEVLVVAPAEHETVEAATGRVDAIRVGVGGVVVDWVAGVGVGGEGGFAVDDGGRKGAADGEGVADDVPLAGRTGKEVEELAEVVDEPGELHPAWLAIAAHGFGGLKEVFDLRKGGVWVGVVDQGVEFLDRGPDGHPGASAGVEGGAGGEVIGDCLFGVLFKVEGSDSVAGFFVLPKLSLVWGCIGGVGILREVSGL